MNYQKFYDFGKNLIENPLAEKPDKKRKIVVNKDENGVKDDYVDTSDEEAYQERKKIKKAIKKTKSFKKEEDTTPKKLKYFNVNTILNDDDYVSSKSSITNDTGIDVGVFKFKHKPQKLYIDLISRIDKLNEDNLDTDEEDYLSNFDGKLPPEETKELQPKFMEEFLDRIETQKELFSDSNKITLVAAPYLGKEWDDDLSPTEKQSIYKSLVGYYESLGFSVNMDKINRRAYNEKKTLNAQYDTIIEEYLIKADKLFQKYSSQLNKGQYEEFEEKIAELKKKFIKQHDDVFDQTMFLTEYDLAKNDDKVYTKRLFDDDFDHLPIKYRADIGDFKRPAMLFDKKIEITDKNLVLKAYSQMHGNVPMKSNMKITKKIIKKKLGLKK